MGEFENDNDIHLTAPDDGRTSRAPSYPPSMPGYPPKTNSFAITSFVLAFFVTILSIVFGHIALSQIRRTGEKGRGLALAGLWISYLSIVASIVTIGIIWGMTVSAQNAYKSPLSYGNNGPIGTQTYDDAPPPVAPDPAYSPPPAAPIAKGPAGVPQPLNSLPGNDADRAYCQNRGVLLWLAESATFRGALCDIDDATTLVSMSRDVGGNVVLAATADQDSYSATAPDGTVYTFTQNSITVAAASKTFQESPILWKPGTSSALTSPGDLGLSTPISYPACDDSVIVVYGTSWNPATNVSEVEKLLAANPGSSYMRTDLSCHSFKGPSTDNSGGEYVYAVYTPEPSAQAACQQIAGTPYYGRWTSNQREPGNNALVC